MPLSVPIACAIFALVTFGRSDRGEGLSGVVQVNTEFLNEAWASVTKVVVLGQPQGIERTTVKDLEELDIPHEVYSPTSSEAYFQALEQGPISHRVASLEFESYFVAVGTVRHGAAAATTPAYKEFLRDLFNVAFYMMANHPNLVDKLDQSGRSTLGKHCFKYAALMAGQYYFNGNAPPSERDELEDSHVLNEDWGKVEKVRDGDASGRVSCSAFKQFYQTKHNNNSDSYSAFLNRVCGVAFSMMNGKPPEDLDKKMIQPSEAIVRIPTLGGHCFRYAGLMAGEFYFNGKDGFKNSLMLEL